MVVTRLRLRDFRSYSAAEVGLGERLTVVHGPNGAGKTNLLEALYFGCTSRSCQSAPPPVGRRHKSKVPPAAAPSEALAEEGIFART